MIIQLNPPIPVTTPKGKALAILLVDYGIEADLQWVCFQDKNGECWQWKNTQIRAQKNITQMKKFLISLLIDVANLSISSFKKGNFMKKEELEYLRFEKDYIYKVKRNCMLKKIDNRTFCALLIILSFYLFYALTT